MRFPPGPVAGRPLEPSMRTQMAGYFGQDLSQERVHTAGSDAQTAQSAKALNARAYTAGNHIVFAPGQYAPQTPQGQYLLVH